MTRNEDYTRDVTVEWASGTEMHVTGFRMEGLIGYGTLQWTNETDHPIKVSTNIEDVKVIVNPGRQVRINHLGGGIITRLFDSEGVDLPIVQVDNWLIESDTNDD